MNRTNDSSSLIFIITHSTKSPKHVFLNKKKSTRIYIFFHLAKSALLFAEIFIWRNFSSSFSGNSPFTFFLSFRIPKVWELRDRLNSQSDREGKKRGREGKRNETKRNETKLGRRVYSSGWLRECVRKGAIHESRSGRTNITRSIHTLDGSNERCYAYLVWYFLPSLRAFTRERGQTFYGCDHDLRCNSDRMIFQSLTRRDQISEKHDKSRSCVLFKKKKKKYSFFLITNAWSISFTFTFDFKDYQRRIPTFNRR